MDKNIAPKKKYFQSRNDEDMTKYADTQLKKIKLGNKSADVLENSNAVRENEQVAEFAEEVADPAAELAVDLPEIAHRTEDMITDNNTFETEDFDDDKTITSSEDENEYENADDYFEGRFNLKRDYDISENNFEPQYYQDIANERANVSPDYNLSDEIYTDEEDFMNPKKPQSLKDLINSEEYNQKITTPADVTPLEILYMILKFSVVHRLPLATLSNIVSLVNSIFEKPIVPGSKYMIDKFFNESQNVEFHVTCSKCRRYIGKLVDVVCEYTCPRCEFQARTVDACIKNCIAIINPSNTIGQLLEAHQDYYYKTLYDERPTDFIRDIHDGKLYKEFRNSLSVEDRYSYVTATFNTDGAEPFKKSPRSLWPMYLMINEIPPQDRFENIIPCALWFDRKKPKMSALLKLFVDLTTFIEVKKINCTIKGKKLSIKLFPILSCVDTIARAPMQGLMQFNGKFGCNWCQHPTEYFQGATRYPLTRFPIPKRTKKETEAAMRSLPKKLTRKIVKQKKGVKSQSPLIDIKCFDIIEGFVPDYMHAILLGVAKQVTGYFIPSDIKKKEEYQRLLDKIKLPNQACRFTRSIEDNKYWKAREWENWILYASSIIFKSKNEKNYVDYWSLLVESVHLLLQSEISYDDLNRANAMFHDFVGQTEKLFGKRAMTYNIHQLLHITESVMNWGPLWAHSAFAFEAGNHKLLQSIHCGNGVIQQILRFINISHSTSILENRLFSEERTVAKTYYCNTFGKKVKKCIKVMNITYFGKGDEVDSNMRSQLNFSENCKYFYRMVKDNCLYMSCEKQNERSDNSVAIFLDGVEEKYMQIIKFAVDFDRKKEVTLFKRLDYSIENSTKYCSKLKQIIPNSRYDSVFAVNSNKIKSVCANMEIDNNQYVCKVPNLLYY